MWADDRLSSVSLRGLFGFANQIAGSPNGEGFYETANNRRLEMQIRFAF